MRAELHIYAIKTAEKNDFERDENKLCSCCVCHLNPQWKYSIDQITPMESFSALAFLKLGPSCEIIAGAKLCC